LPRFTIFVLEFETVPAAWYLSFFVSMIHALFLFYFVDQPVVVFLARLVNPVHGTIPAKAIVVFEMFWKT
jgi:hypothetical protein